MRTSKKLKRAILTTASPHLFNHDTNYLPVDIYGFPENSIHPKSSDSLLWCFT